MIVIKRDGTSEEMSFDKITARVKMMCKGLSPTINPQKLALKVMNSLYDGVTTSEIDTELAETSASMSTIHPDYSQLAANISVSNLHKNTQGSFIQKMASLYNYVNPKTGGYAPIVSKEIFDLAWSYREEIESHIKYSRDYTYDYFGFKTLEKSYLLKIDGRIVERPQDMLMRVSLGIHGEDLKSAFRTYDLMSLKKMTHATPTLFNAGTPRPQMSSCFLINLKDDSIEGIYDTLKTTALISKDAGGIGLSIHKTRSTGSYISGTNGISNGIVPMLKVFNETARYVDQGGGKRKGSFAVYLEPWHADIFDFLELKKNHGKEEMRARDLFYAMWINDLFMERVENNESWSLMCPNECPGLAEVHGDKFNELYEAYEEEGKYVAKIKARDLWEKIIVSQIETGTPYMLYKDSVNEKSNQKNLGTIKSSNLCTEIMEYTAPDEVAVCNLASISLPSFIVKGEFNHADLFEVVYQATLNLNKVIDKNYYPVPEAENSNMRHRPIGLGVQGLADLFIQLRMPFTSDKAKKLNKDIFETIYFASLSASNDLAIKEGNYETFKGSPLSYGQFQFDMWGVKSEDLSGRWDWNGLRLKIVEHGVRNSLLVAPMPTASTSQILGNNECFEPITSNMYTRRVLSGEFVVINKYLIKDLIELGLWNDDFRQALMNENGSVQNLPISDELKELYKTVWEMSMKDIIDMSADRGIFIDQSQSLNLFLESPTVGALTSMHFYAWKKGLKTGMYYLRTKAAANATKFTTDKGALKRVQDKVNKANEKSNDEMSVEDFRVMVNKSRRDSDDGEDCLMCGS